MGYWCTKVNTGEVIMSPQFVHGRVVDGELLVGCSRTSVVEPSRGTSQYVVEVAFYSRCHNSWRVLARRLKGETYDPDGELVSFFQGGEAPTLIEAVEVMGHMTQRFGPLEAPLPPHDVASGKVV